MNIKQAKKTKCNKIYSESIPVQRMHMERYVLPG